MYIPKHFSETNSSKLIAFMKQYNFGIVVNTKNNIPLATHLPFIIEQRDEKVFLLSHMALANEQWNYFDGSEVLVIFAEPHAYISPSFYEKKQNVPTWNFVAVHCYGIPQLIEDEAAKLQLMEKTITVFEEAYMKQFRELDSKYVNGLLKCIKAFEIQVIRMEGKYKLSQNKTQTERANIIGSFEKSENDQLKAIAQLMKQQENDRHND